MAGTITPIPDEILIPAINAALVHFSGYCTDKWGEKEACYCREFCGAAFAFVETDWIRKRAINLRKAGWLVSVNKGPKRKKLEQPTGEYAEYLKSDHWKKYRESVLKFWDYSCCLCYGQAVDVHHRTYMRLGEELQTDCVALCRDCHMKVHSQMPDGNDELNNNDNLLF